MYFSVRNFLYPIIFINFATFFKYNNVKFGKQQRTKKKRFEYHEQNL